MVSVTCHPETKPAGAHSNEEVMLSGQINTQFVDHKLRPQRKGVCSFFPAYSKLSVSPVSTTPHAIFNHQTEDYHHTVQ